MIDFSSPKHRSKFGYLLLAPAVILMALIIIYPILLSVDISLQDVRIARIGGDHAPWTTKNYEWLFHSEEFWNAISVTARMVLIVGGISLIIGLATALLVNQNFKGRALARLFVALPWAVPEVVATVIWAWMLDSSFGVINWMLLKTGLVSQAVQFGSNATAAFMAVCFVMIWKGYPLVSIMLLAGLQSIPAEQYQAAKVDGANVWQRFIYVTLPNLAPVIGVTSVMTTLWVFRDFSIIYVLTQGGPIGATTTLSMLTFEQAFAFFRMGQGAAVGVVTMIICAIISRALVGRFAKSVH
ncbi:carbohydrate ABC transporter permease [Rhizobium sp. SSA_523]|uniref:carbohydrate ABC transporter permease n=1 Tax=Rhizobium sp. SSA_523 TaxID=2952477 RepID=UPI002090AC16|nr:sugar ABC transporter permease [Rhizobium sp. SSA_523]MCO5732196.1 sugar ABC transporter permease [Rhizobium sp. SSA_523]WKC21390.1 sugar ABC transporter permease [Rhizobium sp. SSA_523]